MLLALTLTLSSGLYPGLRLVDDAPVQMAKAQRLAEVEAQLATMPKGIPGGLKALMIVGYCVGGSSLLIGLTLFMTGAVAATFGSGGGALVAAGVFAVLGAAALVGAIVATIVGVSMSAARAQGRTALEKEREELKFSTPPTQPAVPTPVDVPTSVERQRTSPVLLAVF